MFWENSEQVPSKLKFYEPKEELGENRQSHNCAYGELTGAIKTLTVFTQFLLNLIESRVMSTRFGAREYDNSRLLGDSQALEFGGEPAEGARDGLDVGPVEAQQLQRRSPVQARHLPHAARLRYYPEML